MPHLTPRQERFCQSFVHCLNAARAARDAGYAPRTANQQGYRLLKDPRVARRIQDIQWTLAEQHGRDTDTLIGKLEMVYRRAMEDGRYHAAARAVDLQHQFTNPGPFPFHLWRDLTHAAAKVLAADQDKVDAAKWRETRAAAVAAEARQAPTEAAAPAASIDRLRAVGS